MSAIREAVYTALTADATLMALTGDGDAYHQRAPQDATAPWIVFQKMSGTRDWPFAGPPLKTDVWMVKGVARGDSARPAEAIDARVDEVLDTTPLVIDGQHHLFLRRTSDIDYPEDDGAETYHHVGGLFRLMTEAA